METACAVHDRDDSVNSIQVYKYFRVIMNTFECVNFPHQCRSLLLKNFVWNLH